MTPRKLVLGTFVFAATVALISVFFSEEIADVLRQSIGLALTTTMLVAYAVFIPQVIRFKVTEAFHLLGAGVWLLALSFWMPLFRVLFLGSCADDNICHRMQETVSVISLTIALGFMLACLYSNQRRQELDRRLVLAALVVGAIFGIAGLAAGLLSN